MVTVHPTDTRPLDRLRARSVEQAAPYGLAEPCMVATRGLLPGGYAKVSWHSRTWLAHRLVEHLTNGPIADDMLVLHRCDVRACWRASHLYRGDTLQNMADVAARGRNPRSNRTHCPRGHPYSAENTHVNRQGSRLCRTCNRERVAARRAR